MKSISILLFFVFFAVFSAHNQLYHEAKELKSFGNMIKFISELKKGGQLQDAINEEDLDSNSRLLISGFKLSY